MLLPVLGMLTYTGCNGNFPFSGQDPAQAIAGEVSRVEDDSVFIQTGIWKETESEDTSELELTGEEREIRITKDTVIRLQDTKRPDNEAEGDPEDVLFVSDLQEEDVVSVSLDKKENPLEILVISRGRPGRVGKPREAEDYDAAAELAVDIETDGETYTSAGIDENAVHVYGEARAVLKNARLTRDSMDSTGGRDSSLYGVGAALLTTNGISYIQDSTVTTNAPGGIGIFSYGDGVSYATNTAITTRQNTSGGLQTANGGTLYGWNLDVETSGTASPAVKSDRGGGNIVLDGGSYRSLGTDSPAIYCTANMAFQGAELTAGSSGAAVIKEWGRLHLYDCDLAGNMADDLYNEVVWNVLLYQSGTRDHEAGKSIFEMQDGTLAAGNGGMFYTTNTESAITLSNVKIVYPEIRDFFLKCTGNDSQKEWGKTGYNGAECLFTAIDQNMEGDIIWDDISQLDFYMTKNSNLKGAVLKDKSFAKEEQEGFCHLYMGEGCTWTVTGDSTLTRLSCKGKIVDDGGNTVTVRGTDGTTYIQGTGKYTITVNDYETAANMPGASELSSWTEHQATLPEEK